MELQWQGSAHQHVGMPVGNTDGRVVTPFTKKQADYLFAPRMQTNRQKTIHTFTERTIG